MKTKNKVIGYAIIIGSFSVVQAMVYYGAYLEKQDWSLVFKETFSNFEFALGFNLFIIIPIIWIILDVRKNKKTNLK